MNKTIASILTATLALATAAMLVGCQADSPSKVVSNLLDATKANDVSSIAQHYAGTDLDLSENVFNNLFSNDEASKDQPKEELTESQQKATDAITAKLLDFDYAVNDEQIDGDNATVAVTFTTYDIKKPVGDALTDYMTDAFSAAFMEAFGGAKMNQEALEESFYEDITEGLNKLEGKTVTADVTFHLSKIDGEWKVDQLDDTIINALTGGLYSAIDDFSKQMEEPAEADAA